MSFPQSKKINPAKELYLAGGCFWGVEEYFSRIPGVLSVSSGYANGHIENPAYEEVCTGKTGFAEAVHIIYNPDQVLLKTLISQFFKIIDPTSLNKQGNDIGNQYRTGIYYVDDTDISVIQSVINTVQQNYVKPVVVELLPLINFYPAEDYHQNYLKKNPDGYCHIHFDSLKDLPPPEKQTGSNYNKPNENYKRQSYKKPDDNEIRRKAMQLHSKTKQNLRFQALIGLLTNRVFTLIL